MNTDKHGCNYGFGFAQPPEYGKCWSEKENRFLSGVEGKEVQ